MSFEATKSINSKYDNKVTIVQKWNGVRVSIPREFIEEFRTDLIQKRLTRMNKSKKMLLKLKERQIELGKLFGRGKDNQIIGFGNILEPIETREKVAGFVGVSYKTLQKAEELVKAADQESER